MEQSIARMSGQIQAMQQEMQELQRLAEQLMQSNRQHVQHLQNRSPQNQQVYQITGHEQASVQLLQHLTEVCLEMNQHLRTISMQVAGRGGLQAASPTRTIARKQSVRLPEFPRASASGGTSQPMQTMAAAQGTEEAQVQRLSSATEVLNPFDAGMTSATDANQGGHMFASTQGSSKMQTPRPSYPSNLNTQQNQASSSSIGQHLTNQTSNQPLGQSQGQTSSQSLQPQFNQPLGQAFHQSVSQPSSQVQAQPLGQSLNQPTSQQLSQTQSQKFSQPLGQASNQTMSQPLGQSLSQQLNQPLGQPSSQSLAQQLGQSPTQPLDSDMKSNDTTSREEPHYQHYPYNRSST